ncbi:DNA/RNA non-specific endonuclease [Streptomyces sp. NPDC005820]|uniref:DNA/RNA non-specific endonuclease n=1 Tax=Streptomyces sp. NPDC005820 TaxID=3157069 RepID=UPI0034101093
MDAARIQQGALERALILDHTLAEITAFIPIEALAPNGLLADGNGTGTDTQNRGDCRRGGEGWVEYNDLDSANGNRATGVEACLDSDYFDTHEGSSTVQGIKPPGYQWARAYVGHLGGLDPALAVNACHLLGSDLRGSGTDLRNLATCSRQANAAVRGDGRIDDHMFSYESQVKDAVDHGQVVHYKVTPQYSGARTVPVSFDITARGTMPDGSPGIAFSLTVPNSVHSPRKGWKNYGMVIDSRSGLPVPTGSLP